MKKLFFANLMPAIESEGIMYKLDGEHEVAVGDDWDGDIESYIRERDSKITADKHFVEECRFFHKEYPLNRR